tara:strand:+ start:3155 stop:3823 length:669 start_codon:yes stop_codon:yes gene_type:complete
MLKKSIGITHKILKHPKYDESLDCLDIRWSKLLTKLDFLPVPLATVEKKYVSTQLDALQLDGVILSGGDTPSMNLRNLNKIKITKKNKNNIFRDTYEFQLVIECLKRKIPIVGVCRGLQILNIIYGGSLIKVSGHANKSKHKITIDKKNKFFDLPFKVNSYHNYGISKETLSPELLPLAFDSEGNIEALQHQVEKVIGIMWHPEREKTVQKNDHKLFKKFFL